MYGSICEPFMKTTRSRSDKETLNQVREQVNKPEQIWRTCLKLFSIHIIHLCPGLFN